MRVSFIGVSLFFENMLIFIIVDVFSFVFVKDYSISFIVESLGKKVNVSEMVNVEFDVIFIIEGFVKGFFVIFCMIVFDIVSNVLISVVVVVFGSWRLCIIWWDVFVGWKWKMVFYIVCKWIFVVLRDMDKSVLRYSKFIFVIRIMIVLYDFDVYWIFFDVVCLFFFWFNSCIFFLILIMIINCCFSILFFFVDLIECFK